MAANPARAAAEFVIATMTTRKLSLTTAESCTGGLLAGMLTSVPGASNVFYGGYVTYANSAKTRMIGVQARMIGDYGAVSAQVARAMADGARNTSRTDLAISVTGIAGPDGGTDRKPIGLVYIACATSEGTDVVEHRFGDIGRDKIRQASVEAALLLLRQVLERAEQPA